MGSKGKGVLSYVLGWLGGLIVLFGMKDNTKNDVRHAGQAIIVSGADIAFSIVLSVINGALYAMAGFSIPFVGTLVSILCFALRIIGLVKVLKDDPDPKLPVVGDLAEQWFAKQIAAAPDVAPAVMPKFDPNTGKPINPQPEAKFDPNTGEPITQPEPTPAPQANFDPNTGEPLNKPVEEAPAAAEEAPAEEAPTEAPAEEKPADTNQE